ncbi:MAG: type II secretion system protein [Phycisphaerales bacterium JB039]
MPQSTVRPGPGRTRRRLPAFTMIELLVVIGIISVLVAIVVLVGGRVAGSGKQSATLNMISILDAGLGAVTQERGRLPRAVARDPRSTGSTTSYWAVADGAWGDPADPAEQINSGGWFLQIAADVPGAMDLSGVDPQLLRPYSPTPTDRISRDPDVTQPELATPTDAWGNPMRFVHPDFDGNLKVTDLKKEYGDAPSGGAWVINEITRIGASGSAGDLNADGGFCPGNQPYFYSAGPDGKVGVVLDADQVVQDFNEDNVYAAVPEFDRQEPR